MGTTKRAILLVWLGSQLGLFASAPVLARDSSRAFLDRFAGTFSGRGTFLRGVQGNERHLSCNVTGTRPNRNALVIKGSCGVFIFRSGVSATIRCHPASGHYTGLWQDRNSTSYLSGWRSGNVLTLSISKRGRAAKAGSKGRMVVRSLGPAGFQLTVLTVGQAERPQRLKVKLQKS